MTARKLIATLSGAIFTIAVAQPALANCGGNFNQWVSGVRAEAEAAGVSKRAIDTILKGVAVDRKVLALDRKQAVFAQSFLQFSDRMVEQYRARLGRSKMKANAKLFKQIEKEYGVPAVVIAAFWALETDFGGYLGDFNTINALATLAHDCRRPELFRPQLIAAMRLIERGDLKKSQMRGAWAGELGQVQILPSDYYEYGVDYDKSGKVDLFKSVPDVFATAANFLRGLGWRPGEPWMQEVKVPKSMAWEEAGIDIRHPRSIWKRWGVTLANGKALPSDNLESSLLLPMGRKGPAFLVYPNFHIYLEWNKSLVYSTTAAFLSTRLAGAPKVTRGNAPDILSVDEAKTLQRRLQARGHDVGKVDGIIGAKTRAATRFEQLAAGMPADAWPTRELLRQLR